jgi:D-xylose transport system substrate-binding protein
VIAALRAQKLNGKVPVTGQDATVAGIQNIITGDQGMTVYKAYVAEAKGSAALVAALSKGADTASLVNGKTQTKTKGDIPSVLATPVIVTKDNIAATVIKDNFLKKEVICKGLAAGAGGIC